MPFESFLGGVFTQMKITSESLMVAAGSSEKVRFLFSLTAF